MDYKTLMEDFYMNIKYIALFSLAIITNMGATESKRLRDAVIRTGAASINLDLCMQQKNNQLEFMKKIWPVNCEKQQQEFAKAIKEYGLAEVNEILESLRC